ncbi:MAG: DMT family transporter [Sneathiella sp.]|uniref:DMT family transporter n=1 Tax=Sneathiella sp. TaxID=1964365 RepID=UPI0030028B6B
MSNQPSTSLYLRHLALLVSVVMLGLSFVGVRSIMMASESPATLGFIRYGFAVLLLLPFLWRLKPAKLPPRIILIVILLGFLQFGLFHIFVNTALQDITASRGAVIFALIPIMTMLIATVAGRDTLTILKVFAALLSFVGVSLAIGEKAFEEGVSGGSWLGETLFFLAICCGATYNAFSARLLRHHSVVQLTVIGMTAGSLLVLPFALFEGFPDGLFAYSTDDWLWLLYLAGPAAAFSLFLFNWGLEKLSPSQAAIYVPIAPVMAAAFGYVILGEHLSSLFLIGLACAIAGPILMYWRKA